MFPVKKSLKREGYGQFYRYKKSAKNAKNLEMSSYKMGFCVYFFQCQKIDVIIQSFLRCKRNNIKLQNFLYSTFIIFYHL